MSSYFIDPLVDWHLQSCMNLFIRIILNDLQLIWLDLVWMLFFCSPLVCQNQFGQSQLPTRKIESHTTSKVDSIWVIDHAMANLALCMGWFSKDERTFQVGFPHPLNTAGGRRIPLAVGSSHRVPQRSGNWWSGCFSDGSRNKLVCSYLDIYMFISCPDIISCHHHSTIICYMRLYAFWLRGTFAFPLPRRHKTCRSLGLGPSCFFLDLGPCIASIAEGLYIHPSYASCQNFCAQELIDIMDRLKDSSWVFWRRFIRQLEFESMGEVVIIIPCQGWRLQWMFLWFNSSTGC